MDTLVKLAVDLGRGSLGTFSAEEANETLRKKFVEILGTDKPKYYTYRKHQYELFEIISVALDSLITEGLTNQFDQWVEIRNLGWGDTNLFKVENPGLFQVATISDGNGNLRRQRISGGQFMVPVSTKGVKIYEEFVMFLAGRIDWPRLVQRVAASYEQNVALDVYNAITNSFNNLTADYGIVGAFNPDTLSTMAAHVEAANANSEVVIYGTKAALGRIAPAQISDKMRDDRNNLGHYGVFNGYNLRTIKQAHLPSTDTFAIADDQLFVLPQPADKMVKLVIEGESIIQETPGGQSADHSMEYTFIKRYGVGVVASTRYGIYRIA